MIACIEDQPVIDKILSHLEKKGELSSTLPETRAPHRQLVLLTTCGMFQDL